MNVEQSNSDENPLINFSVKSSLYTQYAVANNATCSVLWLHTDIKAQILFLKSFKTGNAVKCNGTPLQFKTIIN